MHDMFRLECNWLIIELKTVLGSLKIYFRKQLLICVCHFKTGESLWYLQIKLGTLMASNMFVKQIVQIEISIFHSNTYDEGNCHINLR